MKDLVERNIIGIDYDFSGSSNYLIINVPQGKDVVNYQMQMITSNKTDYFLNVRKVQVNKKIQLYYDLGNKATLSQLIKSERLSKEELLKLILNVLKALEEAEEFELELKGVLLDRRFIYMENLNSKPSFVYLPFYKENDNFQNLIDFLENLREESRIEAGNDIYVTPIINACKNEYTTIDDLKVLVNNLKEDDEDDEEYDYFEEPNNPKSRKGSNSSKENMDSDYLFKDDEDFLNSSANGEVRNFNFNKRDNAEKTFDSSSKERKVKPVKRKRDVPITKEETKRFLEELYDDDENKDNTGNMQSDKDAFSDADMFDIFGNASEGMKNEFSQSETSEGFFENDQYDNHDEMYGKNDYENYFTNDPKINTAVNDDFMKFDGKPGSTFESFDNQQNGNDFETEFIDFEKDFLGGQKAEKQNFEEFVKNRKQPPFNGKDSNDNMFGGYDYEYKEADQYVKQKGKMKSRDSFSEHEDDKPEKEGFFSKLFSKNKKEDTPYFEEEPVRNPRQQERRPEQSYSDNEQEKIPIMYIFVIAVIEIILIAVIGILTVKGVFTDTNSSLPINIASTGITVILFIVIQYIIFKKFFKALNIKSKPSIQEEYREMPKAPIKPQREKQEEKVKGTSIFSIFGSKKENNELDEDKFNYFDNRENVRQGKEIKSRDAHMFRKKDIEQREAFDSINETPIQKSFGGIDRNHVQDNSGQGINDDLFRDFASEDIFSKKADPFQEAEHSFGGKRNHSDYDGDEFEKYEPTNLNPNKNGNQGKKEEFLNMSGRKEKQKEFENRNSEIENANQQRRMKQEQQVRMRQEQQRRTEQEQPEKMRQEQLGRMKQELPEKTMRNQRTPVENHVERMPANIPATELDNVKIEDTVYLNNKKLPYLTVEVDGAAQKIYITKPSFIIGRYIGKVDYVCHSNKVGKIHAEIIARDGLYFINDFNSKNGTYINSYRQRIISNIDYPIDNEDVIILADVEFTFYEK